MRTLAGVGAGSVENIQIEIIARDEAARLIGRHDLRRLERSGMRVVFTGNPPADVKLEESYTWGDLVSDFFYLVPIRGLFVPLGIFGTMLGLVLGLRMGG